MPSTLGSAVSHSFRRGSLDSQITGLPSGSQGTGLPNGLFSAVALYTTVGMPRNCEAPQIQHWAYLSSTQLMLTSSKPWLAVSTSGNHQPWLALTVPCLMP